MSETKQPCNSEPELPILHTDGLIHYKFTGCNECEEKAANLIAEKFGVKKGEKNKCLFLDRDGTINVFNTGLNFKREQIKLIAGIDELIKKFIDNGYKIIVITNQGGIGKGVYTENDLYCVNRLIDGLLRKNGARIDAVYYCPHYLGGNGEYNVKCECRKPGTLLLKKAIEHFNADLSRSIFIGDNVTDKLCAENSGVKFYPFEFRNVIKTQQGFRIVIKEYTQNLIEKIFRYANVE